jgi:hypothetical protein
MLFFLRNLRKGYCADSTTSLTEIAWLNNDISNNNEGLENRGINNQTFSL